MKDVPPVALKSPPPVVMGPPAVTAPTFVMVTPPLPEAIAPVELIENVVVPPAAKAPVVDTVLLIATLPGVTVLASAAVVTVLIAAD